MKNPFKNLQLDPYEQEIEHNLPDITLKQDQTLVDQLAGYAQHTLARKKNINIRLPEKTLIKLKIQASQLGLPYQTYISAVLHQVGAKNNFFRI